MAKRLISQSEWAREKGFSRQYVGKLVKNGTISLINGQIDPKQADAALAAVRVPAKASRADSPRPAQRPAAKQSPAFKVPFEFAAVPQAKNRERNFEDDEFEERGEESLSEQLLRARIKRETEEGRLKELERRKREGQLVDSEEVLKAQLQRASAEREALLAWPRRVAADISAELAQLQLNEKSVIQILEKYMRRHLLERSSQPADESAA